MFHYFGTVTDGKGNSLAAWQVEVVELSDGSTVIPIYSDENETAIIAVSGIANRAKADLAGNYDFFVPDGTYSLRFYDSAGVFQRTQRYLPMYGNANEVLADAIAANTFRVGKAVSTKAALDALAGTYAEGDSAAVYDDSTESLNGIYGYQGSAWVKLSDLPDVAAAVSATAAATSATAAGASADTAADLIAAAEVSAGSYATKAALVADIANIAEGASVNALVDETKGDSWGFYVKEFGALTYQFSLGGTTDESVAATGTFFDTAGADTFNDLAFTAETEMTVADASLTFSKTTSGSLGMDLQVPAANGSALKTCLDYMEVDATFKITNSPNTSASVLYAGFDTDVLGQYAGHVLTFSGAASKYLLYLANANSNRVLAPGVRDGTGGDFDIRIRYRRLAGVAEVQYTVEGVDDSPSLTKTQTMTATSDETPRGFSVPGITANNGEWTCSALKVSASYPNAKYGFIGDSLWGSRIATAYDDGAPQLLRADYSSDVIVASAPGATTGDWAAAEALEGFTKMKPQYAFVLLGVNDLSTAVPEATIQANLTEIVNGLVTQDIIPIVCLTPPIHNANTAALNSWISSQSWRTLDIHTPLLGTGTAIHADYDSGDGVHWNTAGNLVVYNTITAYIAAEGL